MPNDSLSGGSLWRYNPKTDRVEDIAQPQQDQIPPPADAHQRAFMDRLNEAGSDPYDQRMFAEAWETIGLGERLVEGRHP